MLQPRPRRRLRVLDLSNLLECIEDAMKFPREFQAPYRHLDDDRVTRLRDPRLSRHRPVSVNLSALSTRFRTIS